MIEVQIEASLLLVSSDQIVLKGLNNIFSVLEWFFLYVYQSILPV